MEEITVKDRSGVKSVNRVRTCQGVVAYKENQENGHRCRVGVMARLACG